VINPAEAETVRCIFALYRELGSVRRVNEEADRLGLRTKCGTTANGAERGAKPFSRGHLYALPSRRTRRAAICRRCPPRRSGSGVVFTERSVSLPAPSSNAVPTAVIHSNVTRRTVFERRIRFISRRKRDQRPVSRSKWTCGPPCRCVWWLG
jgi:hypothetical protein